MTYRHNNDKNFITSKMNKNWEIDVEKQEIRLKNRPWYIQLFQFLIVKRYTVRELYIFIYDQFHSPDKIKSMMVFSFPINHDNIKKPKGIPFNYVMQGKWTIRETDLGRLIKGPLISENGEKLLVSTDTKINIISRSAIKILIWLTVPGGIYGTWILVKSIFSLE
ncbi:hypothetical protein [Lutibacter sp.]|uniref:hypothetical protein n=1 Tax=Lutibacter sp. TaxID=1925666 RepID=UPI002732A921|nr:hypothetical protein [Lutibacter sp.]MDP3311816.1 hypothetical protein [Lutibacter sp.]